MVTSLQHPMQYVQAALRPQCCSRLLGTLGQVKSSTSCRQRCLLQPFAALQPHRQAYNSHKSVPAACWSVKQVRCVCSCATSPHSRGDSTSTSSSSSTPRARYRRTRRTVSSAPIDSTSSFEQQPLGQQQVSSTPAAMVEQQQHTINGSLQLGALLLQQQQGPKQLQQLGCLLVRQPSPAAQPTDAAEASTIQQVPASPPQQQQQLERSMQPPALTAHRAQMRAVPVAPAAAADLPRSMRYSDYAVQASASSEAAAAYGASTADHLQEVAAAAAAEARAHARAEARARRRSAAVSPGVPSAVVAVAFTDVAVLEDAPRTRRRRASTTSSDTSEGSGSSSSSKRSSRRGATQVGSSTSSKGSSRKQGTRSSGSSSRSSSSSSSSPAGAGVEFPHPPAASPPLPDAAVTGSTAGGGAGSRAGARSSSSAAATAAARTHVSHKQQQQQQQHGQQSEQQGEQQQQQQQHEEQQVLLELQELLAARGIHVPELRFGQQRTLCPDCQGGSTGEDCFAVNLIQAEGTAVWLCHRASCGCEGRVAVRSSQRRSRRSTSSEGGGAGGSSSSSAISSSSSSAISSSSSSSAISSSSSSSMGASAVTRKQEAAAVPPDTSRLQPLSRELLHWLHSRGISSRVLQRNRVMMEQRYCRSLASWVDHIAFPFFSGGRVVNIKYRALPKHFQQSAEGQQVFYGLDDLPPAAQGPLQAVLIVEGELDKLSVEEATGATAILSVPAGASAPSSSSAALRKQQQQQQQQGNGAAGSSSAPLSPTWGDKKYAYVTLALRLLQRCQCIVIGVDADDAGWHTAQQIANRLGRQRCYYLPWPAAGAAGADALQRVAKIAAESGLHVDVAAGLHCKDANDMLMCYGKQLLGLYVKHAPERFPLQ